MATGAAPPDFTTSIGQFRLLANDVNYIDPDSNGVAEFSLFSDEEIQGYVALYPNLLRAVGYGYLGLAARAANESKNVKDYDLAADLTKRAADLRSTARAYFERADVEGEMNGTESTFGVDFGKQFHRWNSIEPSERDVYGWGLY
jgi:hypothetical protein